MDFETRQARDMLRTLVIGGLILGAVGGLMLGLAWPSDVDEQGSTFFTLVGAVVAWLGNALLFVGLIGYGVMLGREASPRKASTT